MNSFPVRKDNAIFAEIKFRHRSSDLFLFIEDEKMPIIYRKIINRLHDNKIDISKIYPLKSKDNVLAKFHEWERDASELNKCFFIVDKDFDHFKGNTIPINDNLIELEYYTIENYFISKEGVVSLIETKVFDKEREEIERLLNWEKWLEEVYLGFKDLFIAYAIAFKYELMANCGISPYRYIVKGDYTIDEVQVNDYVNKVRVVCNRKNIDFENESEVVKHYFMIGENYKYEELIKGKYLFAALMKYLQVTFNEKFDEELASYIIVDNMQLDNLIFLKNQLRVI